MAAALGAAVLASVSEPEMALALALASAPAAAEAVAAGAAPTPPRSTPAAASRPPSAKKPRKQRAPPAARAAPRATRATRPRKPRTRLTISPSELVVTVATEFGQLSDETHALIHRVARLAEVQRSWPRALFTAHFTKSLIFEHVRACTSTIRRAAAAFRGEMAARWNASTESVRQGAHEADTTVLENLSDAAQAYEPSEANSRAF
jgi:hypothetical protein